MYWEDMLYEHGYDEDSIEACHAAARDTRTSVDYVQVAETSFGFLAAVVTSGCCGPHGDWDHSYLSIVASPKFVEAVNDFYDSEIIPVGTYEEMGHKVNDEFKEYQIEDILRKYAEDTGAEFYSLSK